MCKHVEAVRRYAQVASVVDFWWGIATGQEGLILVLPIKRYPHSAIPSASSRSSLSYSARICTADSVYSRWGSFLGDPPNAHTPPLLAFPSPLLPNESSVLPLAGTCCRSVLPPVGTGCRSVLPLVGTCCRQLSTQSMTACWSTFGMRGVI